jgi:hypothetical protein
MNNAAINITAPKRVSWALPHEALAVRRNPEWDKARTTWGTCARLSDGGWLADLFYGFFFVITVLDQFGVFGG